jgi:hypothetical protein
VNRQYEKDLIAENNLLEEVMCSNPNEDIEQLLITNQNELAQITHERSLGAQLRASCMHMEHNEKNSSYFFSKEKARAESKAMTTLITDNGTVLNELKDIAIEQREFYDKPYHEPMIQSQAKLNEANELFLEGIEIETIDDINKTTLDLPITGEEIAEALKELPNNKAPGCDGLDASFYKFFWSRIGDYVCGSIIQGVECGELSIEQKRAVLSLLPKKDKDSRYIKNWRPLSLLNSDYKILAKLLAKRLQTVLHSIISPDQTGCISKRSAHSNIRSIIDVINHAKDKKMLGIIAFIDFEKAFDTVKWDFLYTCMSLKKKALNFFWGNTM